MGIKKHVRHHSDWHGMVNDQPNRSISVAMAAIVFGWIVFRLTQYLGSFYGNKIQRLKHGHPPRGRRIVKPARPISTASMISALGPECVPVIKKVPERRSSVQSFDCYFDVVEIAIGNHSQTICHFPTGEGFRVGVIRQSHCR
jgi:hypothetical protein